MSKRDFVNVDKCRICEMGNFLDSFDLSSVITRIFPRSRGDMRKSEKGLWWHKLIGMAKLPKQEIPAAPNSWKRKECILDQTQRKLIDIFLHASLLSINILIHRIIKKSIVCFPFLSLDIVVVIVEMTKKHTLLVVVKDSK